MSQLSGPPRLVGIVRDNVSGKGQLKDEWEDRSRYVGSRTRSRRKGPAALWPSWTFTLFCTASEWLAWRSDLRGNAVGEFDWTPRTRAADDPEWLEEHTYRARVRSGLQTLTPLGSIDRATGEHVYIVDVEIEGVEPYESEPGASVGYYSVATVDGQRTLAAHDGATITRDDGQPVTLRDGSTVTIHSLTLGPKPTAARYTRRENGVLYIQTRDDA